MGNKKEKFLMALSGIATGIVNGFFGGGGGMVVVPLLVSALKKPPKVAHATAILIILPISIVSGIMYASFGAFKWGMGFPVTLGVVIGGVIGALCLKKLPAKVVVVIFTAAMFAAGVRMLFW